MPKSQNINQRMSIVTLALLDTRGNFAKDGFRNQ